ncbi:TRAP transporter large permease subunit [Chloroflexota bacterium]
MEWYWALLLILGSFLFLMLTGLPIAFCFMLINLIGMFIWFGGTTGLEHLISSLFESLTRFTLLPIPLFTLMGAVMFESGIAPLMMKALDNWIGRVPGRLAFLAVAGGTIFATLSGSGMASTAFLGSVLTPEMERHDYKKAMSIGPILGSSGLAIMIPPTTLGVFLCALASISVGKFLIAIIIPGLLMAALFAVYIIVRCRLNPSLAPPYEVTLPPLSEKLMATVRCVLPLGFIIILVVGFIFLGVATPSEAAASGTIGCFILAAAYGRLNWSVVWKSLKVTIEITVMILMLYMASKAFGEVMAFSGASVGLSESILGLRLSPYLIIIGMQLIVLIAGSAMSEGPIMMITIPIFIPIVAYLGYDLVWFSVIYLINIVLSTISPPYGLVLFVMKGVAPRGTTIGDVFLASIPWMVLEFIVMALVFIFPQLALWLPDLMR